MNGTPFTLNFTASDTQAKVIDKVPTGATLSAHAEFTLTDAWGTNGPGTPLIAETPGTTSTREGDNTVMMYVQYPLECNLSSGLPGDVSIIGTPPAYYTNASPTALPSATESYISGDGITMHFAGWATSDGGTAAISSSIPNDGSYKGHLTLYAVYSSCTVSINPGDSWGADTPIIAETDHLALTAVPAGFPSTPTYTWEVLNPAADAPVTVNASGVVSPVAGASGNATIKVTATCGALTATATQPVTVAAFSLDCNSTEVLVKGGTDKGITASVAGYTGSDIEYNWNVSASPDPANPVVTGYEGGTGSSRTFTPAAGGKVTVSVSVRITGVNKTLPAKTVDIYVLDLALSGGTALTAPTPPDTNYTLTMATADTAGKPVTASLTGISSVPTGLTLSYTWTANSGSADKIELTGSGASYTVKPKAAGTAGFTVTASLGGVSTSATVDVSVAGIVFTLFPKSYVMGSSVANSTMLKAEIQGYSGTVTWGSWSSGTPAVATVGGGTDGATLTWTNMTAVAGGKTEISLTATVGGTTLTAKKDIYVLELELTSSATSGFSAPTASTDGSLLLTTADTTATTVTANLAGFTDGFTYSWTIPTSSTKTTATVASSAPRILSVKPKAGGTTGTESFTVKATCTADNTIYIEKTVAVTVAGLKLTGDSSLFYSHATSATNTIALTLGTEGGIITSSLSSISYSSNATAIATVAETSGGGGCTVTAKKAGTATITVTATAGGKTFSATKDVTILDLVVKNGSTAVPATGNSLESGSTANLTATLEGAPEGSVISYAWSASPAGILSFSPANAAATTVSAVATGNVTITLRASLDGTDYYTTMAFSVGLGVGGLATYLDGLLSAGTVGTLDAPIELPPIVGLTSANWTQIKTVLSNETYKDMFLDLSATQLPGTITNMSSGFSGCKNLVKAPDFSACTEVTNLKSCFNGCENLTEAPDLSACTKVTSLELCFKDCKKLTEPPDLSACTEVTTLDSCFYGCKALEDLSSWTIPAKVTDMYRCFRNSSLTKAPQIPNGVTEMRECFYNCKTMTQAPAEIPASVTQIGDCFSNCIALSGTLKVKANITEATNWHRTFIYVPASLAVKVIPGGGVKAAIEAKDGYGYDPDGNYFITVTEDASLVDP